MRTVSPRTLVVKKLEGVSKLIFRDYHKQITELIGSSHGIYALYDENELENFRDVRSQSALQYARGECLLRRFNGRRKTQHSHYSI